MKCGNVHFNSLRFSNKRILKTTKYLHEQECKYIYTPFRHHQFEAGAMNCCTLHTYMAKPHKSTKVINIKTIKFRYLHVIENN